MDRKNAFEAVIAIANSVDPSEREGFDRDLLMHQLGRVGDAVVSVATVEPPAIEEPELDQVAEPSTMLNPEAKDDHLFRPKIVNLNQRQLLGALLEEYLMEKEDPRTLSSVEVVNRLGLTADLPRRDGELESDYRLRLAGVIDARISRLTKRISSKTELKIPNRQALAEVAIRMHLVGTQDIPQTQP